MTDLASRRMLEGQTIPHAEKVFSLFEPDTELINRGKLPYPIEFGHRVLIVEDSAGFIVKARVMEPGQTDEKTPVLLMTELQNRFHGKIKGASFDKGFWSPSNLQDLKAIVPLVALPKKGKRSGADAAREDPRSLAACASGMPGWSPRFTRFRPATALVCAGTRASRAISATWPWAFWAATFSGWGPSFLRKSASGAGSRCS
ncbi:MAG: hypothetical protein MZW92_00325 [Comamonadaceae bacterium]|nr:hypothetical protein [Comamonadaceae bacterium]